MKREKEYILINLSQLMRHLFAVPTEAEEHADDPGAAPQLDPGLLETLRTQIMRVIRSK
jgi:hypothetical protein